MAERDDALDAWVLGLLPVARRVAARLAVEDTDDLVAEAFARAFARWGHVVSLPYRDAWLLRVLTNLGFDRARRAARVRPPMLRESMDEDIASRLVVRQAVGALPRRQREAIALRYLSDMPELEVSRVLGVSANTLKRHLARARATLRVRLADAWIEED